MNSNPEILKTNIMLFWNDEDIFATSAKAPGPKNEKEDFGFLWTVSKADASENDGKE